jgi:hypothetical protein
MRKLLYAAVLLAGTALASNANAATALTLTGITDHSVGPQSTSQPCIICGTTQAHNPAFFGYNNFQQSGNISSYNAYSTTPTAELPDGTPGNPYTVQQIVNAGGSIFDVAIDVNTNSQRSETLQSFEVLVNGTPQYVYNGPTNIGSIDNNGNGFADWLLSRIDLSRFNATDLVLFHAVWTGAVAGAESFFLTNFTGGTICVGCTPTPTAVPLPPAVALFLSGLVGIGALKRFTKKKVGLA